MFEQSAAYYDDLYAFLDYPAAAEALHRLVQRHHPEARSLLDVACGTGRYLEHLRHHYACEGLDILPALLDTARRRCPDIPLHAGDMTDFALAGRFDVVTCLFCSIGYVVTLPRAEAAIARMAAHLRPGGLLIMEPWVSPEACWTGQVTADLCDRPDLKVMRMHTHEKHGRTSVFDIHYLVGTPQEVRHFTEREVMGLFTDDEYRAAFTAAGLTVSRLPGGLFPGHDYGLYLARREGGRPAS